MSTETKFTPGPWQFVNGRQIRSAKDQIAQVWMMRNGEGVANARLIAAAPELYEALRVFIEWRDKERAGPNWPTEARRDCPEGEAEWKRWWHEQMDLAGQSEELARSAIAKARGE